MAVRTRQEYLKDLATNQVISSSLESGSRLSKSLTESPIAALSFLAGLRYDVETKLLCLSVEPKEGAYLLLSVN